MRIEIYGFGSYFKGYKKYKDIDLLIVHDSSAYDSCIKALSLKRAIVTTINDADVTILSKSEEKYFHFIDKSKATLLYIYSEGTERLAAIEVLKSVRKHNNTLNPTALKRGRLA